MHGLTPCMKRSRIMPHTQFQRTAKLLYKDIRASTVMYLTKVLQVKISRLWSVPIHTWHKGPQLIWQLMLTESPSFDICGTLQYASFNLQKEVLHRLVDCQTHSCCYFRLYLWRQYLSAIWTSRLIDLITTILWIPPIPAHFMHLSLTRPVWA